MSGPAQRTAPVATIEAYPFADAPEPVECTDWEYRRIDEKGCAIAPVADVAGEPALREEFALRLQVESRNNFEAGRRQGWEEGRAAERAEHIPAEQYRAEQLSRIFDDFAAERDRYLRAVEQEVVRLALSVAARVLRRESQMDPLLLLGAVRVALGQLASGTEVRLQVPAADAELWKEAIALLPHPPVRPVIVADDGMRLGDCRLESSLGQVDLGVGAQLGEIGRGVLDRVPGGDEARMMTERPIQQETMQ